MTLLFQGTFKRLDIEACTKTAIPNDSTHSELTLECIAVDVVTELDSRTSLKIEIEMRKNRQAGTVSSIPLLDISIGGTVTGMIPYAFDGQRESETILIAPTESHEKWDKSYF